MTRPTDDQRWSLYVVRCRDGSLYTGISPDVAAAVEVGDRAAASRAEYRFKRLDRRRKLAVLARDGGLAAFAAGG